MAVRTASVKYQSEYLLAVWEGLLDDDTDSGSAVLVAPYTNITVQAVGDFGTGGAITMQGTVDGTTWVALLDADDGEVALLDTSTRILKIMQNPLKIRPLITAGSGTVDLDIHMIASH